MNVKGRLSKHVDFWKNVLMPVIQIQMLFFSGYIVPFFQYLRILIWFWREGGIYIVLSLDDGFCFAGNYSNCLQASNFVKDTHGKAGFVVNEEKSSWAPVHSLEWLGFRWNLVRGTMELQESKLEDIVTLIKNLENFNFFVSARL